jgi:hypothetical protein
MMLNGNDPRCTRLEFVGQFLVEPQDMLTAHRESTHPSSPDSVGPSGRIFHAFLEYSD